MVVVATMTTDTPDEVITLVYCPGCEQLSLAGDVEPVGHPTEGSGDQLGCPRCGARLNSESFFDYCDMQVVDYGE